MNIKSWLHSETSKYIISIVLGLGLASLFRKSCKDENCIKFVAPPLKELESNTYLYGENCYNYSANSSHCDNNKKQVQFA